MLSASVIICTHNRAPFLARAVDAALAAGAAWDLQVVVVDNASTDDTRTVLAELARRAGPRLRVLYEAELGLSAARNRGLFDLQTDVAVFLDDDAVPRAGWLPAMLAPYDDATVASVGGPLVLRFERPPPAWITPAFHPAAGAFDVGGPPRRLRHRGGEWFPCGANISFRVSTARRLGGFSTTVGPVGRRPLLHDETDLCARLDGTGGEVRWAPGAVVDHWVVPDKLTPEFFLERHRRTGESAAVFALRNRGLLRALGAIRWYAPYLAVRPYLPHEPVEPARLLAECQRREALGYLASLARSIPRLTALRRDMKPAAVSA